MQKRPVDSGGGGPPGGPKRATFNPPKRVAGWGGGGGPSSAAPAKAGNAESGAGVLAALERTMHIPAANDVAGMLGAAPPRGVGGGGAAAAAQEARAARLAQQRAARATDAAAMHTCCMGAPSEMGSCAVASTADGCATSSAPTAATGAKAGVAEAVAMLANIKKTMPGPRYQKVCSQL